jgi:hypothetical protein
VIRVTLPQASTVDDGRGCADATTEYWLQRGGARPRLVARACEDMRVAGDGIAGIIGDNHITFDFGAGSGCCYGSYRTVYQLSPLRILHVQACDSDSNSDGAGHEQWVQTAIDPSTLRGESAASAEPRTGPGDDIAADCDPDHPSHRWLPIVRLQAAGIVTAGTALGSCAASMGPDGGGYLLDGRRSLTEVRLLAPDTRSLVIQVADPQAAAPASGPLVSRNHLEVWSSERGVRALTPADDVEPSQLLVDIETGRVEPGSGPSVRPHVTRWPITLAGGVRAHVIRLDYPLSGPAQAALSLPMAFAVVYHRFDQGAQTMALASSQFTANRISRLGETFDVSSFVHCAVRGGVLEVVEPGRVHAPVEAGEVAGLRPSR